VQEYLSYKKRKRKRFEVSCAYDTEWYMIDYPQNTVKIMLHSPRVQINAFLFRFILKITDICAIS